MNNLTPLHIATKFGRLGVVEYLVNQKTDIDAKNKDGLTPLHIAAEIGHISIVEYLFNQKADIEAKDNCLELVVLITPLFISHL